ncbi:MAG TPA: PAS domain S-box protein [Pyrinomonadaceae bacterium]|nr:PAS domain S-box protein [Pyrinomonadaceae bacterium]
MTASQSVRYANVEGVHMSVETRSIAQGFEQLQNIYQLSEAVSRTNTIEEIYSEALNSLQRMLGAHRASVLLFDQDGAMRFKAWRGLSDGYRKAVEGHSPWSPDALNPQPILVSDVKDEPALDALREVIMGEGIRALGFIPLLQQGRLLGKFMIYYDVPHLFSEEEVQLAQIIASHIAFAIERKRTEEKLSLYREIIAHSSEAIAIIDPQGHYLEQNSAHRSLIDYSDEELRGQTPAIHFGEEVFLAIAQELAKGGSYRSEVISRTKSGEALNIGLSAFAVRDEAGAPVCYVGIKRNITERKRAEEALRRSEQELLDFFENASVGLHWVGPDGYIVRANRAELQMLGYEREEYVGHHIAEFHADAGVIEDILRRLRAGEILRDCEARLRCKDGSIKHVLIDSSVMWEDSRFVHTRCFTRDVTARKQAEEKNALLVAQIEVQRQRLNNIVANVPGVVWEAWGEPDAASQRINFVSNYVETMLGYSVEEWLATPNFWLSIVHPDDHDRAAREAAEIFASGKGGTSQFRWIAKDGRVIWVEAQSVVVCDSAYEPVGMRGVTMDITERKRAEEERAYLLERERAARAEAEESNRLKDEFLATLSHELRTPLTAILGWTQLFNTGQLDQETAVRALQTIERNARAQAQLVDDLLDVSRIITGKLRLNVGPVEIIPVIEAAIEAVRPAAEAKEISLQKMFEPLAGQVLGDPDRLQQVVWNLLSNAVKFTPKGGHVQVELGHVNSHLEITVRDDGMGIRKEFLPHVFDRFRQADSTTTRIHGGLGLGLSIVRHLVELHGGAVHVESRGEGQGAAFTVKLPIKASRQMKSSQAITHTLAHSTSEKQVPLDCVPEISGLRVLVVDDEPDTLDMLSLVLRQCGADVTAVASAGEALNALERLKPDVIISDVGMPDEDGYALIRKVRALLPEQGGQIPAAALTAYARTEDRARALSAGFQAHVAKPVEPTELIATVASLAGREKV